MRSPDTLEQALIEFVAILVPLGPELGGPHPTEVAAAISSTVQSLTTMLAINGLLFGLSWGLFSVVTKAASAITGILSRPLVATWRSLRRRLHHLRGQTKDRGDRSQRYRYGRMGRAADDFESWESFSARYDTWERDESLHNQISHALTVLGLSPWATEKEIRKTYRLLMKRYHPDHYMQASPSERANVEDSALKIREAYDTLTRLQCQAH